MRGLGKRGGGLAAALILVAAVAAVSVVGAGATPRGGKCPHPNVIRGTNGPDVLDGNGG